MTQIFIVNGATSPWTVPSDWNAFNNTVLCAGPGGNGAAGTTGTSHDGGSGGGGGAIVGRKNLAVTGTVPFRVPAGGGAVTTRFGNDGSTGTNYFGAQFGVAGTGPSGGAAGGAGGSETAETGGTPPGTADFSYAGGDGGDTTGNNLGGGGGGGAAGPLGVGKAGGTVAAGGGGGGGGSNGGSSSAGAAGSAGNGGNGGNGTSGAGSGAGSNTSATGPITATAGTVGGGGGGSGSYTGTGASSTTGAAGGMDTVYDPTHGAGGGGGGSGTCTANTAGMTVTGGNGSNYGAGGGGTGGTRNTTSTRTGGTGGQGLIVITYHQATQVLLLHGEGTDGSVQIKDSSFARPHDVTVVGGAQIDTAQSKFGGSSILFDGTGDYLLLDGHGDYGFGTGAFTIDFWVRFAAAGGSEMYLYDARPGGAGNPYVTIRRTSGNVLVVNINSGDQIVGSTSLSANTWYHVALARSGTSTKLFLNGTQEGSTYTDSTDYLVSRVTIGARADVAIFLNGWIDELRVLKGTAAWTANFTPESSAYSAANGNLLLHGDGSDGSTAIIDSGTAQRTVGAHGNAQLDTAQKKFGTSSILFDGNGDYLVTRPASDYAFGTADFTIDCWIRRAASNEYFIIFDGRIGASGDCQIYITDANVLIYQDGAGTITGTTTVSASVWHHVAVTRASGSARLFLNGTQEGSTLSDTFYIANPEPKIGANPGAPIWSNGWLDEFRVLKGRAHWTSNFTPWNIPYDEPANILLLHCNGTDGSTTFTDSGDLTAHTVTANGNAQVDTAQSKFGGASALFDGTGDYLNVA